MLLRFINFVKLQICNQTALNYPKTDIKVEQLSVKINDRLLFKDLCFNVKSGEKAIIKGKSGTGKTTLLHTLMGFHEIDKGKIFIKNLFLSPENIDKIRMRISWVPQNVFLPFENVKNAIRYPFGFKANRNMNISENIIVQELKKLNLPSSILTHNFNQLSGGEKQRILILIAKLLKREIILLDEPTSALDEETKNIVVDYLFAMPQTLLIVSHDAEVINRADKVITLNP
ncbi:MAG: ATP-binding cassette domain-containing protein [Bacteroidetes bacterium]|nr:MAG: ATP-binding cassette domain-containing protein [Bacteroidota bacterium]